MADYTAATLAASIIALAASGSLSATEAALSPAFSTAFAAASRTLALASSAFFASPPLDGTGATILSIFWAIILQLGKVL